MSDIFDLLNILEMLYYHVDTLVTGYCVPWLYVKQTRIGVDKWFWIGNFPLLMEGDPSFTGDFDSLNYSWICCICIGKIFHSHIIGIQMFSSRFLGMIFYPYQKADGLNLPDSLNLLGWFPVPHKKKSRILGSRKALPLPFYPSNCKRKHLKYLLIIWLVLAEYFFASSTCYLSYL